MEIDSDEPALFRALEDTESNYINKDDFAYSALPSGNVISVVRPKLALGIRALIGEDFWFPKARLSAFLFELKESNYSLNFLPTGRFADEESIMTASVSTAF